MSIYQWSDDEIKRHYEEMNEFERVLSHRRKLFWRLDDAVTRMDLFLGGKISKSKCIMTLRDAFNTKIWRQTNGEEKYPLLHTLRLLRSHPHRDKMVRSEVIPALREVRDLLPVK